MTYRVYDVAAIPCTYKGINFRSRTEARWAVFFDSLKWNWIYEHDFYRLPSGFYLPDFYLPDFMAHAEVKPDEFTPAEHKKCIELSELFSDTQVLQLVGNPGPYSISVIENGAFLTEGIPVQKSSKFYPMFYTDVFSKIDFQETVRAAVSAKDHSF